MSGHLKHQDEANLILFNTYFCLLIGDFNFGLHKENLVFTKKVKKFMVKLNLGHYTILQSRKRGVYLYFLNIHKSVPLICKHFQAINNTNVFFNLKKRMNQVQIMCIEVISKAMIAFEP